METPSNQDHQSALILQTLLMLSQRVAALDGRLDEIHQSVMAQRVDKEWYTTDELAKALNKSQYTIQERWCNDGRIECEKNPENGKWRIPGHEYGRLADGGGLKPKRAT